MFIMKYLCGLLLCLLVIVQCPAADPEDSSVETALRPYCSGDYFSESHLTRFYFETWYYELQLLSGHFVQISFFRTNLGLLPDYCGVQAWISKVGEEPVFAGRLLPLHRYVETPENHCIEFGSRDHVRGLPPLRHELRISVGSKPHVHLHAVFTDMVPGFVLEDGRLLLRKGRRERDVGRLKVAIPRARVTGTMTIGASSTAITGWGFSEHGRVNLRAGRLLQRLSQTRFSDDGHTVSIDVAEGAGRYGGERTGLVFVTDGREVLAAHRPAEISAHEIVERVAFRIPIAFGTVAPGMPASVHASWREEARLHEYMLTDEMNRLESYVVRLLLGEIGFFRSTCSFAAEFPVKGGTGKVSGTGFHCTSARR